ncbi:MULTISPECIES: SlyX family protein [Aeromonas]|jgi:SlyX protein|uniref:Protein SlyX homolog n=2 Tax=Aeromonas TaxID=642 RepID=A0AAP6SXR4_9GAMM|nr:MULTISPECIES: SlyX family protein [Aeromonas]MBP6071042.1 SlyX family protein [Aeromonas sp.]QIY87409.1 SlyX family protein [Aeromonas hydrophila]AHX62368.1 SlyX protein [Aeromonas media WS]AVP93226.1 lysis protein [Aeromonas rivipollensis]MBL0513747.1 SlyX family protein [Aeromonas media]
MSQQVNDRLETLESRLAYAEYTVEQLNEEVTTQGRELDRLKHQIQLLVDKLQSVQPSQIASMAEETPPPHY